MSTAIFTMSHDSICPSLVVGRYQFRLAHRLSIVFLQLLQILHSKVVIDDELLQPIRRQFGYSLLHGGLVGAHPETERAGNHAVLLHHGLVRDLEQGAEGDGLVPKVMPICFAFFP